MWLKWHGYLLLSLGVYPLLLSAILTVALCYFQRSVNYTAIQAAHWLLWNICKFHFYHNVPREDWEDMLKWLLKRGGCTHLCEMRAVSFSLFIYFFISISIFNPNWKKYRNAYYLAKNVKIWFRLHIVQSYTYLHYSVFCTPNNRWSVTHPCHV